MRLLRLVFPFGFLLGLAANVPASAAPIAMPGFPYREPLSATVASMSLGTGETCLDSAKRGSVRVLPGHPKLEFRYRIRKGRAPLMVILPGLGSDWDDPSPRGVAQMYCQAGFSVLVIPNPMHRYFILSASSVGAAGDTPADAQDLIRALQAVLKKIQDKYPGRIHSTELTGISLGGLDALAVAAITEKSEPGAIHFDRIIALHPGVDLYEAMEILDQYYVLPSTWAPAERSSRIADALNQVFANAKDGDPLHLSVDEMKFLVGLEFHESLSDAMLSSWEQMDQIQVPWTSRERSQLVDLSAGMTFHDYALHTLFPALESRSDRAGLTFDRMVAESSLEAFVGDLVGDPRVRIFSSADDFVLGARGLEVLQRLPDTQLRLYEHGGHLGSLLYPAVRADIVRTAKGQ